MKNSKLRRVLLLLACAVLLVSLSVGATLAYLMDDTTVVQNTFTVGSVYIDIWETDTDKDTDTSDNWIIDGEDQGKDKKNAYKVYPGMEYVKDPTIYVQKGSEDCYVGAIITVTAKDFTKLKELVGYEGGYLGFNGIVKGGVFEQAYTENPTGTWSNEHIKLIQVPGDTANTFYVVWQDIQKMNENADTLLTLFTSIDIPDDWDNDDIAKMDGLDIQIKAFAVQAEGFKSENGKTAAENALVAAFENDFTVLN